MKYSEIKSSIIHQFSQENPRANEVVFFIMGQPGGGKSACAREALKELGFTRENNNFVEFKASLREPVDVLGVPRTTGQFTEWLPPQEFYKLRKGVGRVALLLDELSDSTVPMQNALCGVIHDRFAGDYALSDQLFIVATGNRTEDKSGANRITSKLAGRTLRLDFTEDWEELRAYALHADWPIELIQFLNFRRDLVSDFDANRFANPTPRTWEKTALLSPMLPHHLLFDNVKGNVGEGAAAEYTGFLKIWQSLPNLDTILLDPENAKVPEDLATKYAVIAAVSKKATKDNFDRVLMYVGKFPQELQATSMAQILARSPELTNTKAFNEWASKNFEVFV